MPPPRKTIAIVDDDASLRKALDRQLSASGFNCVTFASAEEFLLVAAVWNPPRMARLWLPCLAAFGVYGVWRVVLA